MCSQSNESGIMLTLIRISSSFLEAIILQHQTTAHSTIQMHFYFSVVNKIASIKPKLFIYSLDYRIIIAVAPHLLKHYVTISTPMITTVHRHHTKKDFVG